MGQIHIAYATHTNTGTPNESQPPVDQATNSPVPVLLWCRGRGKKNAEK